MFSSSSSSSSLSFLLVFCLCLTCVLLPAPSNATLRGVATNEFAGGCDDLTLLSNVSWYYNWGQQPTANVSSCSWPDNRFVEYVPMIWGSGSVVSNIVSKLPANFRYLMSFNEPNFQSQSNLMPAQAATLWMNVQQQLQTAGILNSIKIGAPSASPGGFMSPQDWLTQFYGNCTGCKFDFQNFHIYDCNSPYFDSGSVGYWIGVAASFGKPVWLTEFDCPSPPATTVAEELKFMSSVLPYLDSHSSVERYSWFSVRTTNVGTIPSLLAGNSLTDVGAYYNSAGDCMTNVNGAITTAACGPSAAAVTTTPQPSHSSSVSTTATTSTLSTTVATSTAVTIVTTLFTIVTSSTIVPQVSPSSAWRTVPAIGFAALTLLAAALLVIG